MNSIDVPPRWCIENRSYNSTGHDRAEDNGSETAIDAQECYSI